MEMLGQEGWVLGEGGEWTLNMAEKMRNQQLADQLAGLNAQANVGPAASPAPWMPGEMPVQAPQTTAALTAPVGQTGMEKFSSKMLEISPMLASMGAGLMKGGPLEGVTQAIAGGVQGAAVGRERQKILDLLGGQGFQEGPERSYGGVSTLGLSPEQVSGLYDIAEKQRLTERDWPLKVMDTVGNLYQRVITGDYHAAQIPYIQAQAENMKAQTKYLPYKQRMEFDEKIAEIESKLAGIAKTRAETKAIPTETAYKEAQIKALPPSYAAEVQGKIAVARAEPYQPVVTDRGITVINKATGKPEIEIPISKSFTSSETNFAWTQTLGNFISKAKASIDAKFGVGSQEAKAEWDSLRYIMGKEDLTGNLHAAVLLDTLSPEDKVTFNRVMTLYREGEQYGIPPDQTQIRVNAMLGIKPEAAAPKGLKEKQPGKAAPAAPAPAPRAAREAAPKPPPQAVGATGRQLDPAKFTGRPIGPYRGSAGTSVYWDGVTAWEIGVAAPAPAPAPSGAAKPAPKPAEAVRLKPIGLTTREWKGKSLKERTGGK